MNKVRLKNISKESSIIGTTYDRKIIAYDRLEKYVYCFDDFQNILWANKELIGSVTNITERLLLFSLDDISILVDSNTGNIKDQIQISFLGCDNSKIIGLSTDVPDKTVQYDITSNTITWMKDFILSSINHIKNNYIYGLMFDSKYKLMRDILTCINIKNGEILWIYSISNTPSYLITNLILPILCTV